MILKYSNNNPHTRMLNYKGNDDLFDFLRQDGVYFWIGIKDNFWADGEPVEWTNYKSGNIILSLRVWKSCTRSDALLNRLDGTLCVYSAKYSIAC